MMCVYIPIYTEMVCRVFPLAKGLGKNIPTNTEMF